MFAYHSQCDALKAKYSKIPNSFHFNSSAWALASKQRIKVASPPCPEFDDLPF